MWLSKQMKPRIPTVDAEMGITTIAGEQAGVMTRGEVRSLPVYGPGGYLWLPENDAEVLVVQGGPGGEEQCVAGMRQTMEADLQPGEICIRGGKGSTIRLKNDGTIEMRGQISILGALMVNGEPYRPCECKKESV